MFESLGRRYVPRVHGWIRRIPAVVLILGLLGLLVLAWFKSQTGGVVPQRSRGDGRSITRRPK